MGSWGHDAFDNDAAADWATEFEGADAETGLGLLREALVNTTTGYVDAFEGAIAVAAAEVVSWLVEPASMDQSSYNRAIVSWVRAHRPAPNAQLVRGARHVAERIQSPRHSELAEAWVETGEESWNEAVQATVLRLGGS